MIEVFAVVLLVGFLTYYLVRHPIKSLKVFAGGMGLLVLGGTVILMFLWALFRWGAV